MTAQTTDSSLTFPDARGRLDIQVPRTLTCESIVYVLRDESGRRWLGTERPDVTGGVMGHLLPGQQVKPNSVIGDGDHVGFLIPPTAPVRTDGIGVAYYCPDGLLGALLPPPPR